MSHPARLSLRAPPHLPFIQGWPGIPSSSSRKDPAVHGTVEVRLGPEPIKARWIRVEIRKFESLPPGYPYSSAGETWEHVGEICTLWSAPAGKDWDTLEQADFKFLLPLPENTPPSVELAKATGVRYELVAALCYRQKGGMFKKEGAPIMKISEPLVITNHDLHSAWPLYNIPDKGTVVGANGEVTLSIQRPCSAFGPNDRILLTATLKSSRPQPFKLKGFECHLHECVTAIPPAPDSQPTKKSKKPPPRPVTKRRTVASARCAVDENVGRGGEKSARMDMPAPNNGLLVTVNHARTMEVAYELEVKAICDGLPEVKMGGIKYIVGPFAKTHAQQAVKDIGHVDRLCPGLPNGDQPRQVSGPIINSPPQPAFAPTSRPPFPRPGTYGQDQPPRSTSYPISQPVQGFVARDDLRRKSSDTSTMTTTTGTTYDVSAQNQTNRVLSVSNRPGGLMFPSPHPAGELMRSATERTTDTYVTSPSSPPPETQETHTRSEGGHGDEQAKRYSSGTAATFGRWDHDLHKAIAPDGTPSRVQNTSPGPTSPNTSPPQSRLPPPSAWPTAEQEKMRLFNDARNRAAAAQQSTGASLYTIGLDRTVPSDPPDYAKPNAAKPTTTSHAASPSQPPKAGSSSQPRESKPVERAYLSAAEEKELQRKRYEAATNRLASGSRPLSQGSSINEAQGSGMSLIPKEDPIPYDAIFPSGPSGSSTVGPSVSVNNVAGPSTSKSGGKSMVNEAISEKDQTKRYYEAQDRVASTGTRQSTASPAQLAQSPSTSTFNRNKQGTQNESHARSASGQTAAPVLSEKEQMRRYYEAQDRVARVSTGQSSSAHSPPVATSTPSPPRSTLDPKVLGINGGPPMTALSEKEQMRKYYEAQDRVEKAAGGEPSASGSGSGSGWPDPQSASTTMDTPKKAGPSNNAQSQLSASNGSFPSAAEEKDLMRKRFESAQAAVDRTRMGSTAPMVEESTSPIPSHLYSPPESPFARDPAVKMGKAKATSQSSRTSFPPDNNAPPPPLPAKPPKEYIDLLSPVEEGGSSFARLGLGYPSLSTSGRGTPVGNGLVDRG